MTKLRRGDQNGEQKRIGRSGSDRHRSASAAQAGFRCREHGGIDDAVRNVFDKDAAFARAIVGELAARYRDVMRDLKANKLRPSLERLANYILRLAPKRGAQKLGNTTSFKLPIEKRTLASYLGVAPEHLSRALAQLAEHGVIISGQTITIKDKKRLQHLARPHLLIDDPGS